MLTNCKAQSPTPQIGHQVIILTPDIPILCRHAQNYTLGRLSIDQPPRRRPLGFVRHAFISPPRMVFLTSEQLNFIWRGSLVSWIPDSNLKQDSAFSVLDSGFQSTGFRIPRAKNSWIPESGFPYMGRQSSLFHYNWSWPSPSFT